MSADLAREEDAAAFGDLVRSAEKPVIRLKAACVPTQSHAAAAGLMAQEFGAPPAASTDRLTAHGVSNSPIGGGAALCGTGQAVTAPHI